MTSNKIVNFTDDMFESVLSENLVGIEFIQLYTDSVLTEITRISEELGLYCIDYSNIV